MSRCVASGPGPVRRLRVRLLHGGQRRGGREVRGGSDRGAEEEARAAIANMDGVEIAGRPVRVNEARARPEPRRDFRRSY